MTFDEDFLFLVWVTRLIFRRYYEMSFSHISLVIHNILSELPVFLVICNTQIRHNVSVTSTNLKIDLHSNVRPVMEEINWMICLFPFLRKSKLHLLKVKTCLTEVNLVLLACNEWSGPTITWILLFFEIYCAIL